METKSALAKKVFDSVIMRAEQKQSAFQMAIHCCWEQKMGET